MTRNVCTHEKVREEVEEAIKFLGKLKNNLNGAPRKALKNQQSLVLNILNAF
jgi:hypothetical protein